MLYGIGCDLCAAARLAQKLTGAHGESFARRVFGPAERQALRLPWGESAPSSHAAESAAADFAAKEAFLKAAGTGLGGFALDEVEAVRLPGGAPAYRFAGKAAAWMQENGLCARLTLAHENGLAMAFCTLEKAD